MDVGIIGFASSGKTALFNALTRSEADVGGFGVPGAEPNVAVVKVPDPRVDRLVGIYDPKKIVHATITYIDVAGIEAVEGRSAGAIDEKLLHALANCDALLAVVCGFDRGGRAPDIEAETQSIQAELVLSDLSKVEGRLERIEKQIGKIVGPDKASLEREKSVLDACREQLEDEKPIRSREFNDDEEKVLRTYQFMTVKPLVIVINLGEDEISQGGAADAWEKKISQAGMPPGTSVVACCAEAEMEISRLETEAEQREFLDSYGIAEAAAARIIRVSYETLGLISFFTAGPTEVHAWTLRAGLSVVKAAGTIHSDMERGFIRADVIGVEELFELGSWNDAKKVGRLRLEGKNYIMRDGDVMEVRFSV